MSETFRGRKLQDHYEEPHGSERDSVLPGEDGWEELEHLLCGMSIHGYHFRS